MPYKPRAVSTSASRPTSASAVAPPLAGAIATATCCDIVDVSYVGEIESSSRTFEASSRRCAPGSPETRATIVSARAVPRAQRQIDVRPRLLTDREVLRSACHADDLEAVAGRRYDVTADNGWRARPEQVRDDVVDDDDVRGLWTIVLVEIAPFDNRDAQGTEVV